MAGKLPVRKQIASGLNGMNLWLFVGAASAFLGVAAGAFGAHGLQGFIGARALEIFQTGVQYHLIHALATAALGLSSQSRFRAACALFTLGTLLFSGSLYLYAITGNAAFVFATPIGGTGFLAGWALLAYQALRGR
jgi:uncharacterized membrane protein YgdD (TMEM256/DUF423 family)